MAARTENNHVGHVRLRRDHVSGLEPGRVVGRQGTRRAKVAAQEGQVMTARQKRTLELVGRPGARIVWRQVAGLDERDSLSAGARFELGADCFGSISHEVVAADKGLRRERRYAIRRLHIGVQHADDIVCTCYPGGETRDRCRRNVVKTEPSGP